METSNIIALALGGAGFIISIVGLFVTPILNLKSKRLEIRLENRFIPDYALENRGNFMG